jgi:hypothetical protein
MGYIERFEYDIFVSYAEADNQSMDGSDGWVSAFVKRFRAALSQRLGGHDPSIHFGNHLQANQQLDDILKAVRESALFLAVGSRAFIARQWTNLELSTFADTGAGAARIFLIECMPPWPDQHYPAPIQAHRRHKFHVPAGHQEKVDVPLSPVTDTVRFNQLVHDLAEWVSGALRLLKYEGTARASLPDEIAAPVSAVASPSARAVLVAQVTDDLEEEATGLRRYLEQFDIRILPEQPYPQGGAEFSEAFRRDAERAEVFVQLLGPRPGRFPPDLPEGYSIHQWQIAQSLKLEVLQWHEPGMEPKPGSSEAYRQLLAGPSVVVSGFEALKAQVKEAALRPRAAEATRPRSAELAFIDVDHADLDVGRTVQSQFNGKNISTVLPLFNQGSSATRSDLEENLIESDVLVFIYGSTRPEWIRSQLRLYNKVRPRRTADPRALAICIVPPADKPDLGMSISGSRVIDMNAGGIEPLQRFLDELLK